MESMDSALRSGARVLALLSPDYLSSDYCAAEWQAALADDPQNKKQRLIVFKVTDCKPAGLLRPIPFIDLISMRGNPTALAQAVRSVLPPLSVMRAVTAGATIDRDVNWEVSSFTGREDALSILHNALFEDSGMAAVTPAIAFGMGGVGKSALALEYGWRHRDDYSILWWLNADKEGGIVEGLIRLGSRFIANIDMEPDRTRAARIVVDSIFSMLEKPALLVFDNLEDRSLLSKWKPLSNCHVLVTSRRRGWSAGFTAIELGQMSPDEASDYLRKESGRSLPRNEVERLTQAVDYLPLALAHAAAFLRDRPATSAASYLKRIEEHLHRAPEGADYPRAVYATFQEALMNAEKRAPGSATILCLASFCAPERVPFELFSQLPKEGDLVPVFADGTLGTSLSLSVVDANFPENALSALATLSLITMKLEIESFSVHRLVQAACRDLLSSVTRIWIDKLVVVLSVLFPDGKFESWAVCSRLAPHVEAMLRYASDSTAPQLPALLFRASQYQLYRLNLLRAEPLLRAALTAAERIFDSESEHVYGPLHGLAYVLSETNRNEEAEQFSRRGLAITEKRFGVDHPDVAVLLAGLAKILFETNRNSEAETMLRRALKIDEKNYGPYGEQVGIDLTYLGSSFFKGERFEEAEQMFSRALAISEAVLNPDNPEIAFHLNNLGTVLRKTGRYVEARTLIERALAIVQKALGEDHPTTGLIRRNLTLCASETNGNV